MYRKSWSSQVNKKLRKEGWRNIVEGKCLSLWKKTVAFASIIQLLNRKLLWRNEKVGEANIIILRKPKIYILCVFRNKKKTHYLMIPMLFRI